MEDYSVDFNSSEDLQNLRQIFVKNGFILVKNVFNETETDEMQNAIAQELDNFHPEEHPMSVFNSYDEDKHVSNQYFLDSVSKISFFYEDGAVNKENDHLTVEKEKAINKIGHALHEFNPVFKKYTFSDKIRQPSIGGAVMPHVDSTFLHTRASDASKPIECGPVIGVWIAMDKATTENGCLWFVPGSQKEEKSDYRFVRTAPSDEEMLRFVGIKPSYDELCYVSVEVERGSLVLIDGNVVHKSEANLSSKSRHAYTFHVFDSTYEWPASNWLQETKDYKFPLLLPLQ